MKDYDDIEDVENTKLLFPLVLKTSDIRKQTTTNRIPTTRNIGYFMFIR
jgi:hypothetical protein